MDYFSKAILFLNSLYYLPPLVQQLAGDVIQYPAGAVFQGVEQLAGGDDSGVVNHLRCPQEAVRRFQSSQIGLFLFHNPGRL